MGELVSVTGTTQSEIQVSVESLHSQREKVEQVNSRFQQIGEGMEFLHEAVSAMNQGVITVRDANGDITNDIQDISTVAERVSNETALCTDTVQKVVSSMDDFGGLVDETFGQMRKLTAIVNDDLDSD
jgi:methyl-accepting chemotaxis protein